MMINTEVVSTIESIIEKLKKDQTYDGSWRYCLETNPVTDVYFIILLRLLEIEEEEELIEQLVKRIKSIQAGNGAWKLYHDGEGDLDTTVEAYYALLFSGLSNRGDEHMKKAEQFIRSKGGVEKITNLFTLVLLAITGEIPWPKNLKIPPEFILLPNCFPINKYDLVGHARIHFFPIMIMANQKFSIKNKYTPNIRHLYVKKNFPKMNASLFHVLLKLITLPTKVVPPLSKHLYKKSLLKAEQYMLNRIEPDGTVYGFAPATIYLLFALLAIGYKKQSHIIYQAICGLKSLICNAHLQVSTSTVWDTAIASFSLQEADVNCTNPLITKANTYLISRQHDIPGDWIVRNKKTKPGGWAFSDINTMYPDVDDTVIVLRALKRSTHIDPLITQSWNRGFNWVLSMQNDDGGWPAFEKNIDKSFIKFLVPYDETKDFANDPSTNDLTGRVLQFLGHDCGMTLNHLRINKAVRWLKKQQEKNGSWYGRWGISYIHGTSAVVLGLVSVGVPIEDPSIKRAFEWMVSIQNKDGGWGESCRSDVKKKYVPLRYSTPTQTAWALEMLIEGHDQPTRDINRGIRYLIHSLQSNDWKTVYPTGGGIPGRVYFYYHSLNHTWALLTLAKYKKKYIEKQ
ncbi:squalene--hopene cyclase [Alkalihalobacillus sp. BA299]|uniref:squalene--hopene cyclase n=1 Tax=Alkalihalobacillus sp. BA299 TaxID=2815938 RepID=UPI001FFDF316|nr:squalene--hopene cyclase [Alkalihalobacillus sp. BA299]